MVYIVLSNLPWALLVGYLLFQRSQDVVAQRAREDQLLNRIQAPAVAVSQSMPEGDPPEFVPMDDTPYADAKWDEFVLEADK